MNEVEVVRVVAAILACGDERERADHLPAPRPLGVGNEGELVRAPHRAAQKPHALEAPLDHEVVQHVVERARVGVRVAPFADEKLRAQGADVPGRKVALRENVRTAPVEQRRLAIAVRLLQEGKLLRQRLERALNPLALARMLELAGVKARPAERGEEAGVIGGEGAGLAAARRDADHEIGPAGGVGAVLYQPRQLPGEVAHAAQLAQPLRLALKAPRAVRVGGSLHQA